MTRDEMKFESAEERFLIMTSQNDVTDIEACKYIQKKFNREIAIKLWEKYCK